MLKNMKIKYKLIKDIFLHKDIKNVGIIPNYSEFLANEYYIKQQMMRDETSTKILFKDLLCDWLDLKNETQELKEQREIYDLPGYFVAARDFVGKDELENHYEVRKKQRELEKTKVIPKFFIKDGKITKEGKEDDEKKRSRNNNKVVPKY